MLPGMTTDAGTQQTEPWTADASTFGARLALVRQHMGWGNVKTAAEKCGLPVESWRNWERDGVEPRRMTTIAMTIASATGCDFLWLVHGVEVPKPVVVGIRDRPRVVHVVLPAAIRRTCSRV